MKSLLRIGKVTKDLWPLYAGVSIFSILVAAANQVMPLLTKIIVDQLTLITSHKGANIKIVVWCVIGIFLADVAATFASNIGGYIGDQLQARLQKSLSQQYYQHLLKLPQRYYDQEQTGKIISQLNRSISQITSFAQAFSNNFLQFIFSTILSLAIVFWYSWQVGIMLAMLYPIFIWLTTRTSAKWQEYQKQINQDVDIANGRFAEAISQIRVVKSFGRQARELDFFKKQYGQAVKTTQPQSKLWHKQDVLRRLVLNVIFLGVYAYLFIAAAHGHYSLGVTILLMQYAAAIRMPIFSISFIIDMSQRAVANTRDYFAVLDQPTEVDKRGPLAVSSGQINFEGVTFSYDDTPVLKDLTFSLPAGKVVALVGESGQGKTTITSLLLGLYEPVGGQIKIDGQDIANVSHGSLRAASSVVFQEPALFSGTVRENIAYGKPGASLTEVEKAAKAANAHEFIAKFNKGYDTPIGERGLKLSGGQKQRIAIARALLKDAPILILDEATSSLDTKSERQVQQALERLMKGRTTLIIAHRLSTIQSADQIITLKNGQVDELGSPEKLAVSGGIYDQLLKLQAHHDKKRLKNYDVV